MENLSNADRPKTSNIGHEGSTETAHFTTHSPEQECGEPLSEQDVDLEEQVKLLQNKVQTLIKLLQNNKEELKNNKEELQKSKMEVLELNMALDAQKNVIQITTSKGQISIDYWMKKYNNKEKEYDDLKKLYDELNGLYTTQKLEDGMKNVNVGEDEVDGSDVLTIPDDILPLVRKALRPSFYWRNPFGCIAGCVMSATHFVLSEDWKHRLCELKFARVVQKKLDQLNKIQNTEVPTEKVKCSYSLKDLHAIGLLKLDHVLSGDIHKDLQLYIEHLSEKALIVIHRNDGLSHCMAIYKRSDQSKPNARVEIFDVQSEKLWPTSSEHVTIVKEFNIYRIEESMKEELKGECSILLCRSERKCACVQQLPQQTPDLK